LQVSPPRIRRKQVCKRLTKHGLQVIDLGTGHIVEGLRASDAEHVEPTANGVAQTSQQLFRAPSVEEDIGRQLQTNGRCVGEEVEVDEPPVEAQCAQKERHPPGPPSPSRDEHANRARNARRWRRSLTHGMASEVRRLAVCGRYLVHHLIYGSAFCRAPAPRRARPADKCAARGRKRQIDTKCHQTRQSMHGRS